MHPWQCACGVGTPPRPPPSRHKRTSQRPTWRHPSISTNTPCAGSPCRPCRAQMPVSVAKHALCPLYAHLGGCAAATETRERHRQLLCLHDGLRGCEAMVHVIRPRHERLAFFLLGLSIARPQRCLDVPLDLGLALHRTHHSHKPPHHQSYNEPALTWQLAVCGAHLALAALQLGRHPGGHRRHLIVFRVRPFRCDCVR